MKLGSVISCMISYRATSGFQMTVIRRSWPTVAKSMPCGRRRPSPSGTDSEWWCRRDSANLNLEPCRLSISKVGLSIFLFPDIEVKTSISKFKKWTSISGTILHFEIEKLYFWYQESTFCRYWRYKTSISKPYDIEETLISNFKFKTSRVMCPDIEDLSISKNEPSISVCRHRRFELSISMNVFIDIDIS